MRPVGRRFANIGGPSLPGRLEELLWGESFQRCGQSTPRCLRSRNSGGGPSTPNYRILTAHRDLVAPSPLIQAPKPQFGPGLQEWRSRACRCIANFCGQLLMVRYCAQMMDWIRYSHPNDLPLPCAAFHGDVMMLTAARQEIRSKLEVSVTAVGFWMCLTWLSDRLSPLVLLPPAGRPSARRPGAAGADDSRGARGRRVPADLHSAGHRHRAGEHP